MSPIFCPVCKRINESGATVCVFCNASLEYSQEDQPSTNRMERDTNVLSPAIETEYIKKLDAPEHGVGIYINDFTKPAVTQDSQEFILGRAKTNTPLEEFVDLTPFGGYENGVSQRHAMIRQTDSGFKLMDLGSTNGTWLNRKRLIPNRPYPLASGAQIYLGRLCLYVIYK
jgi:hypothetical protein